MGPRRHWVMRYGEALFTRSALELLKFFLHFLVWFGGERFLPRFPGFVRLTECRVDVAEVVVERGVWLWGQLDRLEHIIQGLSRVVQLKKDPTHAVEESGVLRFEL